MPSPLSPAKRTTTASCGGFAVASFSVRRWVAVATDESFTNASDGFRQFRPVKELTLPFCQHWSERQAVRSLAIVRKRLKCDASWGGTNAKTSGVDLSDLLDAAPDALLSTMR